MKINLIPTFLLIVAGVFLVVDVNASLKKESANNPLFEGWYADPQIRLYGDTYWIFPTGKAKGEKASFEAFSSKNLKDWTRHPRILLADDVTWAHDCLWAPDVTCLDRFYFTENGDIKPVIMTK